MKFILQRLYHTTDNAAGDYTLGYLSNHEGTFRSLCLEDGPNAVKIKGETRIPAGFYELALQKSDTQLTLKNRAAYAALPFFKAHPGWYHIEVTKVPNYSGVYVHAGNDDSHTLGCLLPAYLFDMSLKDKPTAKSMLAVNDFYAAAYPVLNIGGKCFIEIRDEQS